MRKRVENKKKHFSLSSNDAIYMDLLMPFSTRTAGKPCMELYIENKKESIKVVLPSITDKDKSAFLEHFSTAIYCMNQRDAWAHVYA